MKQAKNYVFIGVDNTGKTKTFTQCCFNPQWLQNTSYSGYFIPADNGTPFFSNNGWRTTAGNIIEVRTQQDIFFLTKEDNNADLTASNNQGGAFDTLEIKCFNFSALSYNQGWLNASVCCKQPRFAENPKYNGYFMPFDGDYPLFDPSAWISERGQIKECETKSDSFSVSSYSQTVVVSAGACYLFKGINTSGEIVGYVNKFQNPSLLKNNELSNANTYNLLKVNDTDFLLVNNTDILQINEIETDYFTPANNGYKILSSELFSIKNAQIIEINNGNDFAENTSNCQKVYGANWFDCIENSCYIFKAKGTGSDNTIYSLSYCGNNPKWIDLGGDRFRPGNGSRELHPTWVTSLGEIYTVYDKLTYNNVIVGTTIVSEINVNNCLKKVCTTFRGAIAPGSPNLFTFSICTTNPSWKANGDGTFSPYDGNTNLTLDWKLGASDLKEILYSKNKTWYDLNRNDYYKSGNCNGCIGTQKLISLNGCRNCLRKSCVAYEGIGVGNNIKTVLFSCASNPSFIESSVYPGYFHAADFGKVLTYNWFVQIPRLTAVRTYEEYLKLFYNATNSNYVVGDCNNCLNSRMFPKILEPTKLELRLPDYNYLEFNRENTDTIVKRLQYQGANAELNLTFDNVSQTEKVILESFYRRAKNNVFRMNYYSTQLPTEVNDVLFNYGTQDKYVGWRFKAAPVITPVIITKTAGVYKITVSLYSCIVT
jgi:hypothetical protein